MITRGPLLLVLPACDSIRDLIWKLLFEDKSIKQWEHHHPDLGGLKHRCFEKSINSILTEPNDK